MGNIPNCFPLHARKLWYLNRSARKKYQRVCKHILSFSPLLSLGVQANIMAIGFYLGAVSSMNDHTLVDTR